MEQPTALFPLCSHIKTDGNRCGSAALKGANLCFQHIGGSVSALTRARATTYSANAGLKFAYPSDREAIQYNLSLVAQALVAGKIDNTVANTLNRIYRACELNLSRSETGRLSRYADAEPAAEISNAAADLSETPSRPGHAPEVRNPAPEIRDQENKSGGDDHDQPTPNSYGIVLNEEPCRGPHGQVFVRGVSER